jgi:MFS family permease
LADISYCRKHMAVSDGEKRAAPGALTGADRDRPSLRRSLRSLETPAYRSWFFSQVMSASGTMTQGVAISWLLLRLTGNGVDLGLLTACTFLPSLVLGPYAGALVDRVDRRKLLIITQALLLLFAAAAAVVIGAGIVRAWMLFVISVLTGMVAAPDGTARQVYVVDLVGTERVASAVSLYEVILSVSRIAGPALGGALLATVGAAACCAANAASYLAPLVVLLLHKPAYATAVRVRKGQTLADLGAGLRYARRHKPILVCLFLAAASGMLFSLGVSLPVLATRVFHLGGGGYGLMMSAFGVGALPGALLASAGTSHPTGRRVGGLALVTATAVVGTALAPAAWVAFAGLAVVGCVSIWFIAAANTFVQLTADPGMRGRMMGLWTMALPGSEPVTGPSAGLVTQYVGPREGFGLAGLALAVVATVGWRALSRPPRLVIGQVVVDELVAEYACRVVAGHQVPEIGQSRVQRGRLHQEELAPMRPGAEGSQPLLDGGQHRGNRRRVLAPGEMETSRIPLVERTEPQVIRGYGADFGYPQHRSDLLSDRVKRGECLHGQLTR